MTDKIHPVTKPPGHPKIVDTEGRIILNWERYLTEVTEFHSFITFEPTITSTGGSVSSSTVYAAYLGMRNMFYELFLHFAFQVTGTVSSIEVEIPDKIANLSRYSGFTGLSDGAGGAPQLVGWAGTTSSELTINRPSSTFTAGSTKYFQLHRLFMADK